ncbi:hypothetical protein [Arthrobacter luteolus]|uniref:hypothetical protein n=1 Tax=Arthrobacter luteolus TaxID=98672 RepID=UPI00384CE84F
MTSSAAPVSAVRPETARPLVSHARYRQEPYVRCLLLEVDGKAVAWTRTQVLVHWIDDDGRAHNRWVPASAVARIPRDSSAWQDPYDDFGFYYPAQSPLSAPVR